MRKAAAILLLTLFLFNTIGYKLWFGVAMQRADVKLETALDNKDYNNDQLFTLKVPINLPYQNIACGFERVNGEIIVNGETYKYVQRKVANDTLYLQCIKNTVKIKLQQKSNDYFGKINDVASNNSTKKMPGKSSQSAKFSISDFTNDIAPWKCVLIPFTTTPYSIQFFNNSSTAHLQRLIKPPEVA